MPEILEPTFFDVEEFESPSSKFSPHVDPFSEADEAVLNWADSVRARLEAKREAKKNKQSGDRALESLPVIEASPSLLSDEPLPVIEAVESVGMVESGQNVYRDRDLPVIENNQTLEQTAIPKKSKSKRSGCVGTYRKGKPEYYRYSCRIEGKVKHRHIGSTSCPDARHTVAVIRRYILCEIPSKWVLYNFFNGPDYPEKDDDFHRVYQKLHSFPYELPPLPTPPPDMPKSSVQSIDEL